MKKLTLIFTGCALALSPVLAEDTPKPGGPRGGAPKAAPGKGKGDGSFFKQIDKDGDKAISQEEAGERWERLKALDKDANGKVTMQEMAAARGGAGGPKGPGGPDGKGGKGKGGPEMFKRADKNGDGKISKDEVPEQAWARLGKLDKDGDEAISQEEARAGRPGGPGPGGSPGADAKARGAEMWKRADQNSDGKISKDEVPEQAWARIGKLDKNNDNAVSREEMQAGMATMRGGKGGPKGEGKGGPQGGPGAIFGRYDENKDDKIAESEVPAEMWSRIRKADTDADGLVSKDELGKVYSGYGGRPKGGAKKGDKTPETKTKKRPELETPAS